MQNLDKQNARVDLGASLLKWKKFNKPTAIYYTVFWSIALFLVSSECIPIVIKGHSLSALPTAMLAGFCLSAIVLTFCIRGLVRAYKREKENA